MMHRALRGAIRRVAEPGRRSLAMAVRYKEFGDPQTVLKMEDSPSSSPGADEIAIKVLASPINPADINMIQGVYGIKPNFPAVAGNEGVGIVTKVGSSVQGLAVNDWVIPNGSSGALGMWRQDLTTKAGNVTKVPNDIPVPYAATLSVNPATAYRLLADFVDLKAGDVIIQNGANSMVGMAVIQMARERGIKTINVIRSNRPDSETTLRLLNNLGGDINIRDDWLNSANCREMIAELPPIKLALNCVGGEVATDMARVLGHGGTMVTYGSMSKKPLVVPHDLLTTKALSLRGFWMADWYKKHSAAERTAMINEIATMIRNDKLSFLFSLHDFDDFDYALKTALEPFNFRKIVLNMDYPDRLAEHDARPKEDYNVFTSPAV